MSYFIVQVQTNFEKYVLCNLTELFLQKEVNIVKSIYALDTKIDFDESNEDIKSNVGKYLKQIRIRAYLNNVRYAYYHSNESNLKQIYKGQIRELTKEVKKYPSPRKKNVQLFIRGYIIIETKGDFQQMPSDLYHDIKTIPKVISIPSKFFVPSHEIDYYFEKVKSCL